MASLRMVAMDVDARGACSAKDGAARSASATPGARPSAAGRQQDATAVVGRPTIQATAPIDSLRTLLARPCRPQPLAACRGPVEGPLPTFCGRVPQHGRRSLPPPPLRSHALQNLLLALKLRL